MIELLASGNRGMTCQGAVSGKGGGEEERRDL